MQVFKESKSTPGETIKEFTKVTIRIDERRNPLYEYDDRVIRGVYNTHTLKLSWSEKEFDIIDLNEELIIELARNREKGVIGDIGSVDDRNIKETNLFPSGVNSHLETSKLYSHIPEFFHHIIRKSKHKGRTKIDFLKDNRAKAFIDSIFSQLINVNKKNILNSSFISILSEENEDLQREIRILKSNMELLRKDASDLQSRIDYLEKEMKGGEGDVDYIGFFSRKLLDEIRSRMRIYSWDLIDTMSTDLQFSTSFTTLLVFFVIESSLFLGRLIPPQWFDRPIQSPPMVKYYVRNHIKSNNPEYVELATNKSFPYCSLIKPITNSKLDFTERILAKLVRTSVIDKGYIEYTELGTIISDRRKMKSTLEKIFGKDSFKPIQRAPHKGIIIPRYDVKFQENSNPSYPKPDDILMEVIVNRRILQRRLNRHKVPRFQNEYEKNIFFGLNDYSISKCLLESNCFKMAGKCLLTNRINKETFFVNFIENFFTNSFYQITTQLKHNRQSMIVAKLLFDLVGSGRKYDMLSGEKQILHSYWEPNKSIFGLFPSRKLVKEERALEWNLFHTNIQRAFWWSQICQELRMRKLCVAMVDGMDIVKRIQSVKSKISKVVRLFGFNCSKKKISDNFKNLKTDINVLKQILNGVVESIKGNRDDMEKQRKFLLNLIAKKCVVFLITSLDGSIELCLDWIFTTAENVGSLKEFMNENITNLSRMGIKILYLISDVGLRPVQIEVSKRWGILQANCEGHYGKALRGSFISRDDCVRMIEKEIPFTINSNKSMINIFKDESKDEIEKYCMDWNGYVKRVEDIFNYYNNNDNEEEIEGEGEGEDDIIMNQPNQPDNNGVNSESIIDKNILKNNQDLVSSNLDVYSLPILTTNNRIMKHLSVSDDFEKSYPSFSIYKDKILFFNEKKSNNNNNNKNNKNSEEEDIEMKHGMKKYFNTYTRIIVSSNTTKERVNFETYRIKLLENNNPDINFLRLVFDCSVFSGNEFMNQFLILEVDGIIVCKIKKINTRASKNPVQIEFFNKYKTMKYGMFTQKRLEIETSSTVTDVFRVSVSVFEQIEKTYKNITLKTNLEIIYFGGFRIGEMNLEVLKYLYRKDVQLQNVLPWTSIKLVSHEKQKESLLEDLCNDEVLNFLKSRYPEFISLIRVLEFLNKAYYGHIREKSDLLSNIKDYEHNNITIKELEFVFHDFPENKKKIFSKKSRTTGKLNLITKKETLRILNDESIHVSEFDKNHSHTARMEGVFGRLRSLVSKASAIETDRELAKEVMKFVNLTDLSTPINYDKRPRSRQFYKIYKVKEVKKNISKKKFQEIKEEAESLLFQENGSDNSMETEESWKELNDLISKLRKAINSLRYKTIRQTHHVLGYDNDFSQLFIMSKKERFDRVGMLPRKYRSGSSNGVDEIPQSLKDELQKFKNNNTFKKRVKSRALTLDVETTRSKVPRPAGSLCFCEGETGLTFTTMIFREYVAERLTKINGLTKLVLADAPSSLEVVLAIQELYKYLNCDYVDIVTWNGTSMDNLVLMYLFIECSKPLPNWMRGMIDLMYVEKYLRIIFKGEKKAKFKRQSDAFSFYKCSFGGTTLPNWHFSVEDDSRACRSILIALCNEEVVKEPLSKILSVSEKIVKLEEITVGGCEYNSDKFDQSINTDITEAEECLNLMRSEYNFIEGFSEEDVLEEVINFIETDIDVNDVNLVSDRKKRKDRKRLHNHLDQSNIEFRPPNLTGNVNSQSETNSNKAKNPILDSIFQSYEKRRKIGVKRMQDFDFSKFDNNNNDNNNIMKDDEEINVEGILDSVDQEVVENVHDEENQVHLIIDE